MDIKWISTRARNPVRSIKEKMPFCSSCSHDPEEIKRIYHGWKLSHVKDNNFKDQISRIMLENLDRIIKSGIKCYTSSTTKPDSFDLYGPT